MNEILTECPVCHAPICVQSSELATVKAELEEARQDANSWRQQCDDRVTDVLRIAAERDRLRNQLEYRTEMFGDIEFEELGKSMTEMFNNMTGMKFNNIKEITDWASDKAGLETASFLHVLKDIQAVRDRLAAKVRCAYDWRS